MDEIPEGLEDLIKSIRGEGKSQQSSALAVIAKNQKKKEQRGGSEQVDERILELLGLEDISDFNYTDYKTLLREKVVAARMSGNTGISTDDAELLTNEFKRVKSKSGKFKVRKKINSKAFATAAASKSTAPRRPVTRQSAGALVRTNTFADQQEASNLRKEIEENQEQDEKANDFNKNILAPSLSRIEDNLSNILETISKQFELDKKKTETEKDTDQITRKKKREKEREAKISPVKGLVDKVAKPVKGMFDTILDFFKNILLGGALLWILNFIKNPAKAIQPLIDGLNGIISFLNQAIKTVFDFIFDPINTAIQAIYDGLDSIENALNDAIANLPFGLAGSIPGYPFNNIDPSTAPKLTAPQIPMAQNPFGQPPTTVPGMDGGGLIGPNTGQRIRGMGADTQLVALSPGEVVMNNPAVSMFGADNLLAMNAIAGGSGSNKPKMGSIMGFSNGGQLLGRQGAAPTKDYGTGSGAGSKGYIIIPGHAAGGGAPGEMELTPALANNIIQNMRSRIGPNVPIKVMNMHSSTDNTYDAFIAQQNKLRDLEKQGYEVIEIHMDSSLESGYGTGKGVILPMPGTDAINPVEADFARTSGAFGRTHRGGLAATNRGVSIIELGNMSPQLQQQVLKGGGLSKDQLDILTKPLEDSLFRVIKKEAPSVPSASQKPFDAAAISAMLESRYGVAAQPVPTATITQTLPRPSSLPKPPVEKKTQVVLTDTPAAPAQQPQTSAAMASQTVGPSISPIDGGNNEILVIKSIYNIVG
jgi:hypothetical protein